MELKLQKDIDKTYVLVNHGGETLKWVATAFNQNNFSDDFDLFFQMNLVFARMPRQKQDSIFAVYKDMKKLFEECYDRDELTNGLYIYVKTLYDLVTLEEIEQWIMLHAVGLEARIPDEELSTTFEVKTTNEIRESYSREQTYLRGDYMKLMALSLSLRLMIPIWSEYILKTKTDAGTEFKEFYAFRLMYRSSLMTSEAMLKFREYVIRCIPQEKSKASIVGGVSSDDFPEWVTAQTIIRCLCTRDVRGIMGGTTLVQYIYNNVRERVKRSENSFGGAIRDKPLGNDKGGDDEGRTSVIEAYKVREDISGGKIAYLQWVLNDPMHVAHQLQPDIDLRLVKSALKTTRAAFANTRCRQPQVVLLQYLLVPIITPKSILRMPKPVVDTLLAVAQAVLWHRGHHVLAGLITATVSKDTDLMINSVGGGGRIPKEIVDELTELYPFTKKATPRLKTAKCLNQAIAAIDTLSDELSEYSWTLTIEDQYVQQITGGSTSRRYSLHRDIKTKIAEFVLQQARRPRATSFKELADAAANVNS